MFLQETYEVQDCHWYDDATTDKSSSFVTLTGQNPTITHNTDHYTITSDSNGNNYVYLGTEEYDNVSFEVTLKMHNWNSGIAICGDNGLEGLTSLAFCANDYIYWTFFSSTMRWDLIMKERPFIQNEVYYKLTHTISDNSYTYKIEDMNGNVLKSLEGTYSLPHKRLALAVLGNGSSIDVKDIKVKAL